MSDTKLTVLGPGGFFRLLARDGCELRSNRMPCRKQREQSREQ